MGQMVGVQLSGPVGVITLRRPERHNSLVPELLTEFRRALAEVREHTELRVLLLEAEGRSFSTGGDVRAFDDQGDGIGPYADEIVQLLNDVILAMLELPVPIVAVVHGIVTGGSIGFILAADLVLVAPETTFTPYYSVVGFSPDGGWTAMLPSVIGIKRTAEVLMRNLTITASQAVEWGLANRIVPADQIHAEARKVAADIIAKKSGSIRSTCRLLRTTYADASVRLRAEHREFCANITTGETRGGMTAFLSKGQTMA